MLSCNPRSYACFFSPECSKRCLQFALEAKRIASSNSKLTDLRLGKSQQISWPSERKAETILEDILPVARALNIHSDILKDGLKPTVTFNQQSCEMFRSVLPESRTTLDSSHVELKVMKSSLKYDHLVIF